MEHPLIIYAGPFSFPHGGAAARRVEGNAKSLAAAGFPVEVWSGQMPHDGPHPQVGNQSRAAEAISVRSLGERTAEHRSRFVKHLHYVGMGRSLVRALEAEKRAICAVILYSGYTPYLQRLLAWSRKSGVPVAFDAVEWYDPPRATDWLTDPYYWNTEYAMRRLAPRCRNTIAISRRLENYFSGAGCHTVRIPPTLDVDAVEQGPAVRDHEAPLVLSYTGSPGHKERLGSLIAALIRLGPEASAIKVVIAGVTAEEVLALPDVMALSIKTLPPQVTALGRIAHSEALALTRNADFSVMLRPSKRYAEAGFPTKTVESLAAGTPVFGNLSSDLGDHLRDGETAVLTASTCVDAVMDGLKRLLATPRHTLAPMRRAARREAARAFDYRVYVPAFASFVEHLATPQR
ncbi:MAG: glycosyltransferase [Pseudomonadota bacterium]